MDIYINHNELMQDIEEDIYTAILFAQEGNKDLAIYHKGRADAIENLLEKNGVRNVTLSYKNMFELYKTAIKKADEQ